MTSIGPIGGVTVPTTPVKPQNVPATPKPVTPKPEVENDGDADDGGRGISA